MPDTPGTDAGAARVFPRNSRWTMRRTWQVALVLALASVTGWAALRYSSPSSQPLSDIPVGSRDDADRPGESPGLRWGDGPVAFESTSDRFERAFPFTSRLEIPVAVTVKGASCSCLVSAPDRGDYQPGESGSVRVAIDLTGKPPGSQQYSLELAASAGGREVATTRLQFSVNNRPSLVVTPAAVTLPVGSGPGRVEVVLMDYHASPLRIWEPVVSSPCIKARISERPGLYLPGWRSVVLIEPGPAVPTEGEKRETVTLATSDPARPTVTIDVAIRVESRVRFAPQPVYLRPDPDGRHWTGTVFFWDASGEDIEVQGPAAPESGVTFTVAAGGKKQVSTVRVSREGRPETGSLILQLRATKPCLCPVPLVVRW